MVDKIKCPKRIGLHLLQEGFKVSKLDLWGAEPYSNGGGVLDAFAPDAAGYCL